MWCSVIYGSHLYGKQLFTWLSLVASLMASFVLSFFPLDVLDEIWDVTESVSEGFLTYSFNQNQVSRTCMICNTGDETTEQSLLTCNALAETRCSLLD